MLPTAPPLHNIRPSVYKDEMCPRCLQGTETQDHLWKCPYSWESIQTIATRGTALFWEALSKSQQQASVTGTNIFNGPHSIYDIVQGIVPIEWSTTLQEHGLSATKTQKVVRQVAKFFVQAAHDNIWKPRCEAQVQ
jgi:hypothetical protein